jgi:hypothetical protein
MAKKKRKHVENNERVTYMVGRDYTGLPIYETHILVKHAKHVPTK